MQNVFVILHLLTSRNFMVQTDSRGIKRSNVQQFVKAIFKKLLAELAPKRIKIAYWTRSAVEYIQEAIFSRVTRNIKTVLREINQTRVTSKVCLLLC